MKSLQRWWSGQTAVTRLVLAVGVPLAALAAMYTAKRRQAAPDASEDTPSTTRVPQVVIPGQFGGPIGQSDAGILAQLNAQFDFLEGSIATATEAYGDELGSAVTQLQTQIADIDQSAPASFPHAQTWYNAKGGGYLWLLVAQAESRNDPTHTAAVSALMAQGYSRDERWFSVPRHMAYAKTLGAAPKKGVRK